MNIEKIKSALMLILALITIFLVGLIWDIDFRNDVDEEIKTEKIQVDDVQSLIVPFKVQINLGGEKWASFFYDVEKFFSKNSRVIADSITKNKNDLILAEREYTKLSNKKSVEFIFKNPLNTDFLVSILSNKTVETKFPIPNIKKILLLNDDREHIYISDGTKAISIDLTFKLSSLDDFFSKISSMKHINYQKLSQRFLISVNQDTIVPKGKVDAIPIIVTSRLFDEDYIQLESILANEKVRRVSEGIFGSRMNFVRTAVGSDDSILQIYGYGKSVLEFRSNSDIKYSESISNKKSDSNLINDLKLAKYWLERIDNTDKLVLSSIEKIDTDEGKGFKFSFYKTLNNFPLLHKNLEDYISVEVINSTLASLRTNLNKIEGEYLEIQEFGIGSITNEQLYLMLDKKDNYDRFYKDYIDDYKKSNPQSLDIVPQNILSQINSFDIVYYKEYNRYRPAFLIGIGSRAYIIDFYNYNIIN